MNWEQNNHKCSRYVLPIQQILVKKNLIVLIKNRVDKHTDEKKTEQILINGFLFYWTHKILVNNKLDSSVKG